MMVKSQQINGFYLLRLMLAGLVLSLLYACHAQVETEVIPLQTAVLPSPISPTVTMAISPTFIATPTGPVESACRVPQLHQITTRPVSWLQWSATGEQLYYKLRDSDEYWDFSFEDNTVTPISREQRALLFGESGAVPFEVPDDIKEHEQMVSPSRKRIVFAQRQYLSPTPTAGTGEGSGPTEIHYDIFFLKRDEDTPIHLGQIDGLFDSFTWFPDEKRVLILTSHKLPGTAYVWLADLGSSELVPLLLVGQGQAEIEFEALSPDGNTILFARHPGLYLYDLANGIERETPVPSVVGRAYYWFLSANRLLIVDDFDRPLDFRVAIFDLESYELRQIYEPTLDIHSVELSPNRKYLAIRWDETLQLYVFPVGDMCD